MYILSSRSCSRQLFLNSKTFYYESHLKTHPSHPPATPTTNYNRKYPNYECNISNVRIIKVLTLDFTGEGGRAQMSHTLPHIIPNKSRFSKRDVREELAECTVAHVLHSWCLRRSSIHPRDSNSTFSLDVFIVSTLRVKENQQVPLGEKGTTLSALSNEVARYWQVLCTIIPIVITFLIRTNHFELRACAKSTKCSGRIYSSNAANKLQSPSIRR